MGNESKLAKVLKEKRLAAGLSQRDVADKLGYETPQFISNWERSESNPPINTLKKLAELYLMGSQELYDLVEEEEIRLTTESLRRKFKMAKAR